jgi:hypothetical protein
VDNDARVTVRLNEDGTLAGLDIEGEIDKTNLTEERAPIRSLPVIDNPNNGANTGIAGLG